MQWNLLRADAGWPPRVAALAVFAALGASLVLWSLRWPEPGTAQPVTPHASGPVAELPSAQALLQVLGSSAQPAETAQPQAAQVPLVLAGLVAQAGGQGSALIAVAGAAQKNFRVGTQVAPGLMLQKVDKRQALLGPTLDSPATLTLELPKPAAALP